ncbi:MAG: hypothetical protein PUH25_07035 [Spirochaetales bacterium]|nr:hypothetical protein [Spirochaetales bacterium]
MLKNVMFVGATGDFEIEGTKKSLNGTSWISTKEVYVSQNQSARLKISFDAQRYSAKIYTVKDDTESSFIDISSWSIIDPLDTDIQLIMNCNHDSIYRLSGPIIENLDGTFTYTITELKINNLVFEQV